MNPNPFLGVFFHWLGGLAAASFYVPYRGVRQWSWETYWLAGGFFSWIVAPWTIGLLMTHDLLGVLGRAPGATLFWAWFFGLLWGLGGLTFGLTMRYLGMSLGYGVALGICAVCGTLIPPIFKGQFAGIAASGAGRMTLLGIGVCVGGIALSALSGLSKERELPDEEKKAVVKEFNFEKGLGIALFCGVMSACFAFGLDAAAPLAELSAAAGTPVLWTGLPKLLVILLGGFTSNAIWCVTLNVRRRTGREYFSARAVDGARVPRLANVLLCGLAGVTWYFQFFFYTMGETQMGRFGFSSWTLHMASIIIFSTLWGVALKEWRGTSRRTHLLIAGGIAALIVSTLVIGYGNYLAQSVSSASGQVSRPESSPGKKYQVGVYYFPNYHSDKRNEDYFGKGWTEWKLVREAGPRFPGHQQPKVPLWGYTDEADPKQMAQKIEAASSHGIDAFIFDWYYYDDGPFLQRALDEGFMQAKNNDRLKFSLMWANHDYTDIFPYTLGTKKKLMFPGKISPQTWDKMTDGIIAKYFKHHSYWLIDGAPYFSIYDLGMFIKSFGSVEAAAKGLDMFRQKTKAAGFSDLHLNAVIWGALSVEKNGVSPSILVRQLGFNSVTSYAWYHHGGLTDFPTNPYESVKSTYFEYAERAAALFTIPYYPNVSMGWDPSPRTNQNARFVNSGYPHTPIIVGNTPEAFKLALIQARGFLDAHFEKKGVLTINAWNEWTEGSYLEPDTVHKMNYLDAIKEVFP